MAQLREPRIRRWSDARCRTSRAPLDARPAAGHVSRMRWVGTILICLAVIAGMTSQAFAGHERSSGATAAGHHGPMEHSHANHIGSAEGTSSDVSRLVSDRGCDAAAGHCTTDLAHPLRVGVHLCLSFDCHMGFQRDPVWSHRTPETESPPPRS